METSAELVGTQPLEFWEFGLEDSQNAKISWFHEKKLACTALLDVSRVLISKCPKLEASKDYLN